MLGAIAEARFGVPKEIAYAAWSRLPEDMREVLAKLYARAGMAAPWSGGRS
ncbi:MAG: hypothetical protein ACK4JF_10625 [Methylohalobius sp.]